MSLKDACDRLGVWTVSGVTVVGFDELNAPPGEADLPMLVPELTGTGGDVLRPLGISTDAGQVVFHVFHKLIIAGIGLGSHSERFYGALTHIDNYLGAVVADLTLNGNLLEPLTIADSVVGLVDVMGVLYYGVEFRQRWVLKVT